MAENEDTRMLGFYLPVPRLYMASPTLQAHATHSSSVNALASRGTIRLYTWRWYSYNSVRMKTLMPRTIVGGMARLWILQFTLALLRIFPIARAQEQSGMSIRCWDLRAWKRGDANRLRSLLPYIGCD